MVFLARIKQSDPVSFSHCCHKITFLNSCLLLLYTMTITKLSTKSKCKPLLRLHEGGIVVEYISGLSPLATWGLQKTKYYKYQGTVLIGKVKKGVIFSLLVC